VSKRPLLLYIVVYLLYLAIAIVITYPLVAQFSTHFAGDLPGPGDIYEYVRHIWWFKYALQTGQPLFFHPLFAYPDGIPGAHLWANLLQSFPASLYAFFMPLPAAFNLMILLRLALNGWAMWFLSSQLLAVSDQQSSQKQHEPQRREDVGAQRAPHRKMGAPLQANTRLWFPSLLSGIIYLAFPTVQSHLAASHSGLLVLWPYPFYVYALLRVQETGARQWVALAVLFFVFGCIGNYALVLYVLAPVTAFLPLARLFQRDWVGLRRILVAALFGVFVSFVFLVPAALEVLSQPVIQFGGTFNFSADLLAFAAPSPYNPLFSPLEYPRHILGGNVIEGAGYVGIGAVALALVGIIRFRAARGWLLLLLITWVLSLGPLLKILDQPAVFRIGSEAVSYITLPYALIQDLPWVSIARTPARFNFTVALALALMAGYGAAAMWQWIGNINVGARRALLLQMIRIVLFVAAMGWIMFFPLPTARADLPQALYDLADRDDIRAVFDVPWNSPADKEALYLQTAHQHPLIAGAVTRGTPVDHAKLWLLQQTLDPSLLDAAGVDVIILHRQWVGTEAFDEAFTRAQLGEPFYEDDRFALFYAPDPVEPAAFMALPDPQHLQLGSWSSYLYTPEPSWATWHGALSGADVGVEVLLQDQPVHRWSLGGEMGIILPLWLPSAGYYTATVQLSLDCPSAPPPPLRCRSAQLDGLTIDGFTPATEQSPVTFEHGLTLSAIHVPISAQADSTLSIYLVWRFDEQRSETDVRFVHILSANGDLVAQEDSPIGAPNAGSQWSEQVDISLHDLPQGEYQVSAGWYTYPDIVNFCVLENGTCVANEVQIGTVRIE
jgi:hypothetical protein